MPPGSGFENGDCGCSSPPKWGCAFRLELIIKSRRDATSPSSDTSWLPGHEGTGQGLTNVGSHQQENAAPRFPLDLIVTAPNNEPELPLSEAALFLVALIVFVALMAWTAMLWM